MLLSMGAPLLNVFGRLGIMPLLVLTVNAQPGSLDPDFKAQLNAVASVRTLAVTPAGKVLVACKYVGEGVPQGCLVRLNPDGGFDFGFHTQVGPLGSAPGTFRVQSDDRIIATPWRNSPAYDSIVRLGGDGSIDRTFNSEGKTSGYVSELLLQRDGEVLVRGLVNDAERGTRTGLARLRADGTLDENFREVSLWVENSTAFPYVLVVQDDAKILLAGVFTSVNGQASTNFARLNADGSLDSSFKSPLDLFEYVEAIAVQADGRIVLGGSFYDRIGHSPRQSEGGTRVLTLRLNADGSVDSSFIPVLSTSYSGQCVPSGGSGVVRSEDEIKSLAIQSDGKIIVAGSFVRLNGLPFGNLARLNPDGTLDGNFDSGAGADAGVGPMVLDHDENLLITGCFQTFDHRPAAVLMRVLGGEPAPGPPIFQQPPAVQVLDLGATLMTSALVSGFPPVSYQWRRHGQELAGATHATLILTNLDQRLAGDYELVASNLLGSATSQAIRIGPPILLTSPKSQAVKQGRDALFSVVVTNLLPLSFQWRFQGRDLAGMTNDTLPLTHVNQEQAGDYSVVVSNRIGSVTSAPATLTILLATVPEILVQPASQRVEAGLEVSFSVVATNDLPLTYQWQFNNVNIPGATQAVLTLPEVELSDAGNYQAIIRSEYQSARSVAAVLGVKPVEYVPGVGVVTNRNQASLEAAMASGAPVTFGINGTWLLTHAIVIGTDTTLDAQGRRIVLDGQHLTRHFVVTNGARLTLTNLRLINGAAAGSAGATDQPGQPGQGGSIANWGGSVELIDCTFLSNHVVGGTGGVVDMPGVVGPMGMQGGAGSGGALYSADGQLRIRRCLFADNRSDGGNGSSSEYSGAGGAALGGAIYTSNSVIYLSGVVLSNNFARGGESGGGRPAGGGGGAHGGAWRNEGVTAAVSNCLFIANQALVRTSTGADGEASANGGAVSHGGGTLVIQETLFEGNQTQGGFGVPIPFNLRANGGTARGGAVFNQGHLSVGTSAFVGNECQGGNSPGLLLYLGVAGEADGGAIYDGGQLSLVNCTLNANRAKGGDGSFADQAGLALGGALYSTNQPSLLNVTIAQNSVEAGAGVPPSRASSGSAIAMVGGQARLTNTIVQGVSVQTNVTGLIHDGGHNLCSDNSAGLTAPTSRNDTDPLLGPLQDDGGLTPTMALLPGSPAIDAADSAASPPLDQRGIPRPQGLGVDIGSFELAPKLALISLSDQAAQLECVFQAGQTIRLFTSTNLVDWTVLGTQTTATNGVCQFQDGGRGHWANRFYRVQLQPGL